MACRPKQKIHFFDLSCCTMSQNDQTPYLTGISLIKHRAAKHNSPGTILKDSSLLETHIFECLYDQPNATASIHELFACLKDRQIIPMNESKKRTNRALHNLVQWHILSQKFENQIPTYFPNFYPQHWPASRTKAECATFACSSSKEERAPASPIHSPPPKGQSSYLPLGYDAEDLKPHNFRANWAIDRYTRRLLTEIKLRLNGGIGRNERVSHVEFSINIHSLLTQILRETRQGIIMKAFNRAVLAMEELGWKCHMTKKIQWNSQHVTVPPDTKLILTC